MILNFDLNNMDDYQTFLKVKSLPQFRIKGHTAEVPDEYAYLVGEKRATIQASGNYQAPAWMFDYQRAITSVAVRKQKFAVFLECGLGKTAIFLEFARHAAKQVGRRNVLIVSPLMVIQQTMGEAKRFFGDYPIRQVRANELQSFLNDGDAGIGITNFEAITPDLDRGRLGALIIDESSMLKSHYGKWGTKLIELGRGLDWKLALTGTPAPNDRIEYANHAVFLDAFPTVNSFLARFFINRGQTSERWELRPHALEAFYRALSHWSIFVTNPATYGWKDNADAIPPIHAHVHDIDLTDEQREAVSTETGMLFFTGEAGGIMNRSTLGQIAKGKHKGRSFETRKPDYIRGLVESWPDESTIIWCKFNEEQDSIGELFPGCANISGDTPHEKRMELIDAFKSRQLNVLVSKPKILGFGLNLQVATRQVFSTCQDSYEEYYQAVKRSNRVGSKLPLSVHLPITELERPMMENVLRKAAMVQRDTEEQERIFKKYGIGF